MDGTTRGETASTTAHSRTYEVLGVTRAKVAFALAVMRGAFTAQRYGPLSRLWRKPK